MIDRENVSPDLNNAKRKIVATALVTLTIALALAWYYHQHWPTVAKFVVAIDDCDLLFCDYVLHFHPTAAQILTSAVATPGYFYTAFFALAIHFLTTLPAYYELIAWGIFQACALIILYVYPPLTLRARQLRFYPIYFALLGTSIPILHNIKWGQVSVMLTGLCFLCLYLYQKNLIRTAALILAIAASIKYYSALFALYFIFIRSWRFLGTFFVSCLFLTIVIPILSLGVHGAWSFQHSVADGLPILFAFLRNSLNSQFIGAVFSRLLTSSAHANAIFIPLQLLGFGIFLVNLWLIRALTHRRSHHHALLSFHLLFLSLPFLLGTSWPHYFVYLPFVQTYMLISTAAMNSGAFKGALLLLTACSITFSNVFFLSGFSKWMDYSSRGYLFFSNAALLLTCQLYIARHILAGSNAAAHAIQSDPTQ